MRLLLDEMLSPRIARELRDRGHDVVAIKGDRLELESKSDYELVLALSAEQRAIVTNNAHDFEPIHRRLSAVGREHYGIIISFDRDLPRNKASFGIWIETLNAFLEARPEIDALRNRLTYLP